MTTTPEFEFGEGANFEPAVFDGITGTQVVVIGALTRYTQPTGSWQQKIPGPCSSWFPLNGSSREI